MSSTALRSLVPAALALTLGACGSEAVDPAPPAAAAVERAAAERAPANPPKASVAADSAAASAGTPGAEARALFAKPAVLGASVADGFGLESSDLGVAAELADYLDSALTLEHGEIVRLCDNLLFMNPLGNLEVQSKQAFTERPSVVVAPDLLFWMLYGRQGSEDQRLAMLDRALQIVGVYEFPTVVGTIPDIEDPIPLLIDAAMIPEPETIAEANRRITAFATEHEQIHLVDLAGWFGALLRGDEPSLRGEVLPDSLGDMLQDDGLHASSLGTAALTLACLAALEEPFGLGPGVEWDPVAVEAATAERLGGG